MASELNLTQQDVSGSVLVALSSTSQVSPNYWVNPTNTRELPRGGANTAVPNRLDRNAAQYAPIVSPGRRRSCSRTW